MLCIREYNTHKKTKYLLMKETSEQDFNRIWLNWEIKNQENKGLFSSNFELTITNQGKVQIPLAWLFDLFKQYGILNILRTPNHIPEDPYKLVRFIKKLEQVSKTGQIQL